MTAQQDSILALLRAAQKDYMAGDRDAYDARLRDARAQLECMPDAGTLMGEWELTARMAHVFDIDATLDCLRRAQAYMGGHRSALFTRIPLNLGADSMLNCLYLHTDLHAALPKMQEAARLYDSMTGNGLGFDVLYQAEIAYNCCDLDQASVLAHRVVYTARNTGQIHLAVCGAKLLAQIAKHRGDADGWTYAIHVINQALKDAGDDAYTRNVIHIERYELSVVLGDFESLPGWLRDGVLPMEPANGIMGLGCRVRGDTIPMIGFPLALWTHAMYLTMTEQYDRVLAVDSVQREIGIDANIPMLDLYFSQTRAIALLHRGDRAKAQEILRRVVDTVMRDGMLMVVSEFAPLTDGIVDGLVRERDEVAYRLMSSVSRAVEANPQKILQSVSGVHAIANLTEREREVAALAAEGWSNKEIAAQLHITQQTVKFHLGNVYQKLSVNGRSRMAAVLRNG